MSQEERPTTGGSYTRDPITGALTRNEEAPAETPAAEPAPATEPASKKKGA